MPRMFIASERRRQGAYHVLLLSTGSVASIKIPLIVQALLADPEQRFEVQVAATNTSLTFYDGKSVEEVSHGKSQVWTDQDEWGFWKEKGDPILHIELRRWADIVLVVPCSANTLGKIANGLCDNVVTSVLRALNPVTPTYLFPAMNTFMYTHPITAKQLKVVTEELGYKVIGPQGSKGLACGDIAH
ncbi:hypothetical protein QFC24_001601 [Naganishia onofrii]|uniref:Uncharacterized protein n=1 Tax=Naganishia onofrii TaxID=1851511 RepID=A0ACC2XSI0_9TREE|nr:hypothetical protein QFC24_001601 [Naganishia onofrii]